MSLFAVTVAHMNPEIVAFSLAKGMSTAGHTKDEIKKWILVDHHWPLNRQTTSQIVRAAGNIIGAEIISPERNLGGHGGFNFALEHLKAQGLSEDDLVLCFDPDSNPVTDGWLNALVAVMDSSPYPYVSLMHTEWMEGRGWTHGSVAGVPIVYRDRPEAMNVTVYRARAVWEGMKAPNQYYGGIEAEFFRQGLKGCYTWEHRETYCPVNHPQIYIEWKGLQGGGRYQGNFDQFLKERGIQ